MLLETMLKLKAFTGLSEEEIMEKVSKIDLPYFDIIEFYKCYGKWPNEQNIKVIKLVGIATFYTLHKHGIITL